MPEPEITKLMTNYRNTSIKMKKKRILMIESIQFFKAVCLYGVLRSTLSLAVLQSPTTKKQQLPLNREGP